MHRKLYLSLSLISGLLLLAFMLFAGYEELAPEWKEYQAEYKELFIQNAKNEAMKERAKSLGLGIQQVYLSGLHKDDRCMTCHMGVNNPLMAEAENPFKQHSSTYLKDHPAEKYGCTICHYGQGRALTMEQAHGYEEHWLKPRLKGLYSQSQCGKCHFMDQKLPLEVTMPGGEEYVKGWATYMDNNCLGCHKHESGLYGRPDRIGPVLTPVGKKVDQEWLKKWIKKPKDYLPKTKMPNFLLEDEEVDLIAPYLLSLAKGEKIREPKAKKRLGRKSAIRSGKKLVTQLGCLGCHTINKEGGDFAPDLSNVRSKTYPEWFFFWIKDPKVYQPETKMPNLRIPEKELQNIVAYLNTLQKETASQVRTSADPSGAEAVEKGKKLVKDKGCTGCHEIEKFPLGFNAPPHDSIGSKWPHQLVWSNIKDVDHTLLNWLKIKVVEPRKFATDKIVTKMPTFGFTESDAEAIVAFLLSLTKESVPEKYVKVLNDPNQIEMRGKRFLEDNNCLGCHKINKKGGDIGPDLSDEGKKVRSEWIFTFLKAPQRIRPLQDARMPNFKLTDEQANTDIDYLAHVAQAKFPYIFESKKEVFVEDIEAGKKLYHQELACLGCHTFEGKGGFVGPEHTDLASRLKRQWVVRWLKKPQAIKPDVRMPRFIFKGDDLEFLSYYLLTMGKERFLAVQ